MTNKEVVFWLLIVALVCATISSCFYIVYTTEAATENACVKIAKQLKEMSSEGL